MKDYTKLQQTFKKHFYYNPDTGTIDRLSTGKSALQPNSSRGYSYYRIQHDNKLYNAPQFIHIYTFGTEPPNHIGYKDADQKKYAIQITHQGQRINLGSYKTLEECADTLEAFYSQTT